VSHGEGWLHGINPQGLVTSSLDVGRRLRLAVDGLRRMLCYS